jgi:hypothetical protein
MNPAKKAGLHNEGTMEKVNATHWKVGLLSLLFTVTTVTGTVSAQEKTAPSPGFIGEQGGRGAWPAVAESRADLRAHTLYRPMTVVTGPM